MPQTGLQVFDRTVQETNVWLRDLMNRLGWEDRHRAYRVLKGVLHALRDRMTVDEAAQLGAQLPMLLRGAYYEGWRPAEAPKRVRSKDAFLEFVEAEIKDLRHDGDFDVEQVTEAVFRVITQHVSRGEVEDVIHHMPKTVKDMWPLEATAS